MNFMAKMETEKMKQEQPSETHSEEEQEQPGEKNPAKIEASKTNLAKEQEQGQPTEMKSPEEQEQLNQTNLREEQNLGPPTEIDVAINKPGGLIETKIDQERTQNDEKSDLFDTKMMMVVNHARTEDEQFQNSDESTSGDNPAALTLLIPQSSTAVLTISSPIILTLPSPSSPSNDSKTDSVSDRRVGEGLSADADTGGGSCADAGVEAGVNGYPHTQESAVQVECSSTVEAHSAKEVLDKVEDTAELLTRRPSASLQFKVENLVEENDNNDTNNHNVTNEIPSNQQAVSPSSPTNEKGRKQSKRLTRERLHKKAKLDVRRISRVSSIGKTNSAITNSADTDAGTSASSGFSTAPESITSESGDLNNSANNSSMNSANSITSGSGGLKNSASFGRNKVAPMKFGPESGVDNPMAPQTPDGEYVDLSSLL